MEILRASKQQNFSWSRLQAHFDLWKSRFRIFSPSLRDLFFQLYWTLCLIWSLTDGHHLASIKWSAGSTHSVPFTLSTWQSVLTASSLTSVCHMHESNTTLSDCYIQCVLLTRMWCTELYDDAVKNRLHHESVLKTVINSANRVKTVVVLLHRTLQTEGEGSSYQPLYALSDGTVGRRFAAVKPASPLQDMPGSLVDLNSINSRT